MITDFITLEEEMVHECDLMEIDTSVEDGRDIMASRDVLDVDNVGKR